MDSRTSPSASSCGSFRTSLLRCLAAMAIVSIAAPVSAQVHLRSHSWSHGAGFTGDETVRFGASIGLPFGGVGRSPGSAGGTGFWYATLDGLTIVATETDGPPGEIPKEFELHQNYPNPFNPTTKVRYGVPQKTFVRIAVYNILGQPVAELVNEEKDAGYYHVDWNGRDASGAIAPSGVYFYRIVSGGFIATRSMVLQK